LKREKENTGNEAQEEAKRERERAPEAELEREPGWKRTERISGNRWWKTELDIPVQRQEELKKALRDADSAYGAPFRDIKLRRPDIVWLLRNEENILDSLPDSEKQASIDQTRLNLREADLHELNLSDLPLAKSLLIDANLKDSYLFRVDLERAELSRANLEGANLEEAILRSASAKEAKLEDARMSGTDMRNAYFESAHFDKAFLAEADMRGATLESAHFDDASLDSAKLGGAVLKGAFFNEGTSLKSVWLTDEQYGAASICDVRWNDVNLAVVTDIISQLRILGEEKEAIFFEAHPVEISKWSPLSSQDTKSASYAEAVRANRQLAVALREQGLNEEALYFSYKAQRLQRKVYQYRKQRIRRFVSRLLDFFAGYGYKPWRALRAYVATVIGFALFFYFTSPRNAPLSLLSSFVLSLSNTLRIGFLPSSAILGDLITPASVIEGALAIFVEAMLIATFLRRFLEG
jgi:uncharacterized protein YjbI with pentapeptide repeats